MWRAKLASVLARFEHTDGSEYNATLARKSVLCLAHFGHTVACEYNSNTQGGAPLRFGHCLGRQSKSSGSTSAA